MAFWENLGETISTKGKEVADKARVMSDIAGLKGQITTCKNVVAKNYKEIGKAYYEAHKDDVDSEFAERIEAIKNAERGIQDLEKKIRELKGIASCSKCGAEIPADASFCPKCGEKIDDVYYDEEDNEISDLVIVDEE